MKYFSLDAEMAGQYPGRYSMLEFSLVVIGEEDKFFTAVLPYTSRYYQAEALSVNGYLPPDPNENFDHNRYVAAPSKMFECSHWLEGIEPVVNKRVLVTDNPYFDIAFLRHYFFEALGYWPFAHHSVSLTSLWKGVECSLSSSFRHLRETKHDHTSLNDARGNAEAFTKVMKIMDEQRRSKRH